MDNGDNEISDFSINGDFNWITYLTLMLLL